MPPLPIRYSRDLSCQIWSLDGGLIGRSAGTPDAPLAGGRPGFTERFVGERRWRVYTHVDPERGVRVMIGDNLAIRERLVRDLLLGLVLPAVAGLVALGVLLWLGVSRGLRPLGRIAEAIAARSPDSLAPLKVDPVPSELTPLVRAMDTLLIELDRARQAERAFVANAAHELQTPLAGLKTQAEVARRAIDPAMRDHALERIVASADRTSRLVRQLLDLAGQERHERRAGAWVSIDDAIAAIEQDYGLIAHRSGRRIATACSRPSLEVALDEDALRLALGNLVENAVLHGGPGDVRIECALDGDLELRVIDTGAGIPPEDEDRVRRRFERGRGARATGTGLGLPIAQMAIASAEGNLDFRTLRNGFAVVLRFPPARFRVTTA
ncbi:Sensor protein QseC [Sphingomonas jeddahensis]|uniref:histidine kinase n=1 Tax=Sphingomonas jeddahensis TaxID=1915074 RepID=A0A1V2EWR9_9SPHN|nr:Sensor protein QseC [Sphingomonas jeddahensis]